MKILKEHDEFGWITAVVKGRWCEAKVYDTPSTFGIDNGRVSKLTVSRTDKHDGRKNFFNQMAYNYDRGLDFDNLPKGLLKKIVAELETLPACTK